MNNICKDITCEKLNNCPYENEEILYCPGYLNTTKIESAWEMVRRLNIKYKERFVNKLAKRMKFKSTNLYEIIGYFIWNSNSLQAKEIMKEIEKELKDVCNTK